MTKTKACHRSLSDLIRKIHPTQAQIMLADNGPENLILYLKWTETMTWESEETFKFHFLFLLHDLPVNDQDVFRFGVTR